MKKLYFILAFMLVTLVACCQADQTFDKPVYFNAGFYLGGTLYTSMPAGGTADWNTLLNKPLTFPPATHEHPLLYKPLNWYPTWSEITGKPSTFPPSAHTTAWAEITGKPTEIELINELPQLAYLPLPQKTTAEINATVVPAGTIAMIWDKTLGVVKLWNGSVWKTIITNQ